MSVPVIEFEGVSFTYAGADEASVKKVSLAVEAGECVVLCGRSGCGKTTLTRLANGLAGGFWEGRRTGAVRVEGRNVDEFEEWQLAEHIGSVFQNPRTQFFNLDTTGEIAFALENLGVPRDEMHARVARVADELGATDLLDRSIFKLSGGQMQSIAFASVSVCEPRAYVLDEPSSNLDPVGMERLAALIAKAKAAGSAVLVAEHRLAYLSDAADTYVLIEEGRVAHAWTSSEFEALSAPERTRMGLRSPAPPRTADLVARLRIGATSAFPALEARGIVAEYDRDDEVLRNVTAGFEAGHVTGVVAPNGTGKSTLFKCLAGVHPEVLGHVRIDGAVTVPKKRADEVFLVMQDPDYQLFRPTVRDELMTLPRVEGGIDPARADAMLKRFGLASVADRHPASLSGGQKQRVACALAALSGARALLFDEPTSGLDLDNMRRLARTMRELADEGRAVVVATHDPELLSEACDRIITLG